jgi:transcription-repair coupling factor (superfamily II helicase)
LFIEQPKDLKIKEYIGNVSRGYLGFMIQELSQKVSSMKVVLTQDFATASRLQQELQYLGLATLHFPDWETLPYDQFSPHQDLLSARLSILAKLLDNSINHHILIIPITTIMHKICPLSHVAKFSFDLYIGQKFDLQSTKHRLANCGYINAVQVTEYGEFSVRGSIMDIFPMGSETPIRIDLFDNEIETIMSFDPESQLSLANLEKVTLLPAKEYPFDEDAIAMFRHKWRQIFPGSAHNCPTYMDVSKGEVTSGLEYYLPLFFENTATIFDYLPADTVIIRAYDLEPAINHFWQQINTRFEHYGHNIERPLLPPKELYLAVDQIFGSLNKFKQIVLSAEKITQSTAVNKSISLLTNISFDINDQKPTQKLQDFINSWSGKIIICAQSVGRSTIIQELLNKNGIKVNVANDLTQALQYDTNIFLIVAPFEYGFINEHFALITESELFGNSVVLRRKSKLKSVDLDNAVRNLAELQIDTPVVHIDHGVGLYKGLTVLNINDLEGEFLIIEYTDSDKLYIPVANLHLISKYSVAECDNPPINSLRNNKWVATKKKAVLQINDIAVELLETYAKRDSVVIEPLKLDLEQYTLFAEEFPFEETYDQQQAIDDVLKDLQATRPMDRVVCGDVGFGKTEVAMRAAFMAVQNNLQVAFLVPTTLLAQQHYETLLDRFAKFAININIVSRFKTTKSITQVLNDTAAGKVDILVGTHRLLQNDVRFNNLGLLIIDEEHRFGVQQKEKFKALRNKVHILTLTATPIPRTLNMSMAKIRDLSIIATPPDKRLAVKTFVLPYNETIIQESINRELNRGGQVYYVHNRVETIENAAREISKLTPNAKVVVAHGQMDENQLERVMSNFYNRKFNVLVCTTIIETGIDIPTANTILIERADTFGLAQLHQLRGRVGRSHQQAYAICLTPPGEKKVTSDALKRLEAITEHYALGSGFALASHDLEIRGAGELLGDKQSGNMQAVGFTLFMELLQSAVVALQQGKQFDISKFANDLEVQIQVPALIPDKFVHDIYTRVNLYKRIANARKQSTLDNIKAELIDRFGKLPEQTEYLFDVAAIKVLARRAGICKIKFNNSGGIIEFDPNSANFNDKIKDNLITMMRQDFTTYSFSGGYTLKIVYKVKLSFQDIIKNLYYFFVKLLS